MRRYLKPGTWFMKMSRYDNGDRWVVRDGPGGMVSSNSWLWHWCLRAWFRAMRWIGRSP